MAKTHPASAKYKPPIQKYSLPAQCIYRLPAQLSVPTCQEHKARLSVGELVEYALVCSPLHIK